LLDIIREQTILKKRFKITIIIYKNMRYLVTKYKLKTQKSSL